jgi:hypothetical protein
MVGFAEEATEMPMGNFTVTKRERVINLTNLR